MVREMIQAFYLSYIAYRLYKFFPDGSFEIGWNIYEVSN